MPIILKILFACSLVLNVVLYLRFRKLMYKYRELLGLLVKKVSRKRVDILSSSDYDVNVPVSTKRNDLKAK